MQTIEISGMSITQSIEAPLTIKDTMLMRGNLSMHKSSGMY